MSPKKWGVRKFEFRNFDSKLNSLGATGNQTPQGPAHGAPEGDGPGGPGPGGASGSRLPWGRGRESRRATCRALWSQGGPAPLGPGPGPTEPEGAGSPRPVPKGAWEFWLRSQGRRTRALWSDGGAGPLGARAGPPEPERAGFPGPGLEGTRKLRLRSQGRRARTGARKSLLILAPKPTPARRAPGAVGHGRPGRHPMPGRVRPLLAAGCPAVRVGAKTGRQGKAEGGDGRG